MDVVVENLTKFSKIRKPWIQFLLKQKEVKSLDS